MTDKIGPRPTLLPTATPAAAPAAAPAKAAEMPTTGINEAPLYRHISYFDQNKDGKLTIGEMATGLKKMGVGDVPAYAIAAGTALMRASQTEGKPSLTIDIANAMKSAQGGRSGVIDLTGHVDPKAVEDFVKTVDPRGDGKITQADFDAAGKALAESKEPGHGLVEDVKRGKMEFEFSTAWRTLMTVAGHDDPKGRYMTPDDIRSFFDGSLFYKLAAANEAKTGG